MKIAHISIKNILGIAELELSPQGFTEISGPNGTGKTSILEAIKSVLETGHDATLLRKGEEVGETVLVLDDGTELSKRVTASGSTSAVRRDGKKVSRPAEAIKALTDMLSVNPVDFLRAPKKDRVRVLLESMPIEADAAHLSKLAGVPVRAQPGLHALHVIQMVHTDVYDARTGTNRAIKEKTSTINQLEAAVPPLPSGVSGDEDDIQGAINAAADNRDATLGKIQAKLDGLKDAAQRQIDAIRAKAQADIDAVNAELATQTGKANTARENAKAKYTEATTPMQSQLHTIRNDREASGRRKQTLDTIEALRIELGTLQEDAAAQTKALADIEAYKAQLLSGLPIPGVEVIDGEIYRDGVQFDRLNTAQQVDIAVEIAKLRAADLGIVCVDRIECLDAASLEEFRRRALESGLQLFVTRVSDEEFSIDTADK
jgi:ABC-type cobalamin/Fe3+-siderophores transport system ATPase subunit